MGSQSNEDTGLILDADSHFSIGGVGAALIEGLLSQPLVDLLVMDTQLRIVQAELHVPRVVKLSAEDIVGCFFTDAMEYSDPDAEVAVSRAVLASGTPALDRLVGIHSADSLEVHSTSIFRLEDPQGNVIGLARTTTDVTAREKARNRLALLSSVRQRVGRTLDITATCQELVDTVTVRFPDLTGTVVAGAEPTRFTDIAGVEIVDGVVSGGDPPLAPVDPEVTLRHVASVGCDELLATYPLGDTRAPASDTPYGLVFSDLEPRITTLTPDALWDPEIRDPSTQALIATGAQSMMLVPLTVHGAVLGMAYFYRCGDPEPYDDEDRATACEIAAHAALCLDNARRYTSERLVAATMQRRALPRRPPPQPAVESAYLNLPGRRAGYWFDTIDLPGARTALVVGDVMGEGIEAAMVMGQLRTVVHTLAALDLDPDELMHRLDATATALAQERAALPPADPLHREALTASCLYALFDPFAGTCTICRADHPGPIIAGPDGSIETPDIPEGPPLGSVEKRPFGSCTFEIPEGTVLALHTGSLLADDQTAWEVLSAELSRPGRPLQEQADAVVRAIPEDTRPSAALLLARACSFPADHVATWELTGSDQAASIAREAAVQRLADWGIGQETAFATELVVSELVTNAVRHGAPPVRLRLILDRNLTCEVRDHGSAAPHLRHAGPSDESGRGLYIVSQLTDRWGVRFADGGKVIWAEQTLPVSAGSPR
ncbi:SpoIIE family protein phosphatase [Streptomyces sp. TRM S81-3]|uniref:SpoIIE family protein phosphatase n=1 Tax=Streptomyces griseicoloratus TaxID=2752516 RepID=A0A926QQ07_9ACTN|nr:SpoIIE family protein phosphatase [Streptomyces griseicoloratus]MBD0420294.1 SpoIIE family protein phosphatase [Streptomyces griseicoloratus]